MLNPISLTPFSLFCLLVLWIDALRQVDSAAQGSKGVAGPGGASGRAWFIIIHFTFSGVCENASAAGSQWVDEESWAAPLAQRAPQEPCADGVPPLFPWDNSS